jgi:two-component system response regulator HydG
MIERTLLLIKGDKIEPEDFMKTKKSGTSGTTHAMPSTIDEMEQKMIIKTLEENGNNIARTAEKLGIGRATLYRKMEKHGIHPDKDE